MQGPSDPHLAKGFYLEPTVFADVTMDMRIGKEEIFEPILSILKWNDEGETLAQVNEVEYWLTLLDLDQRSRHRVSRRGGGGGGLRLDHDVSKRFLGAPFGGYKQSGVGREEGIEELISCTREKNTHLNLKRRAGGHEAVCHERTSRRLSPRPSLLSRSLVRGHRSEIMFSVLEVILRPDHIAGQGFSSGQREIPLIASLRILRTFRLGASRTRCPPP